MPFGGDRKHKYFTLIQKQMNSTNDQIKHSTATDGKPPVIGCFSLEREELNPFVKPSTVSITEVGGFETLTYPPTENFK